jgi:hypothetical protein
LRLEDEGVWTRLVQQKLAEPHTGETVLQAKSESVLESLMSARQVTGARQGAHPY